MPPRAFALPSFFLPIVAFLFWNLLFFSYLPVLEADLDFSRQIMMANLYLSNIILILAWFLCGRIIFIVFAVTFALQVGYLMLSLREFGVGVQLLTIALLYLWLKYITNRIESEKLKQMMHREKIQENLNLMQKALEEREHLENALKRKLERLQYMRQFSDHLKETQDLTASAQIITEEVRGLIPEADQVLLYVYDDSSRELSLVASTVKSESYRTKAMKGNDYDEWVIKRSQPLLIEDARTDFRFMSEEASEDQFRSLCVVPLLSKSAICGVLHLGAVEPGVFQTDDLRLLDIAADLSAAVIRNILLYEKTKELSIIDSLTECYLLRYVQERVGEEIQRSIRHSTPFSVVMADIDHFKRYNDQFGHTAGDQALKTVADLIKGEVSSGDIVGRYGGEEFIVVLPQKDLEDAKKIAESIRRAVEAQSFEVRREAHRMTISLGIAEFPKDGTAREEIILKADQRLYEAKRQGRNRICGNI